MSKERVASGRWSDQQARAFLKEIFLAAVASADPGRAVTRHLPDKSAGRCVVIGARKASAAMAAVVNVAWPDVNVRGLVVTRYGHRVPAGRIEVVEASHTVPDTMGMQAAIRMMNIIQRVGTRRSCDRANFRRRVIPSDAASVRGLINMDSWRPD